MASFFSPKTQQYSHGFRLHFNGDFRLKDERTWGSVFLPRQSFKLSALQDLPEKVPLRQYPMDCSRRHRQPKIQADVSLYSVQRAEREFQLKTQMIVHFPDMSNVI